MIWLSLACSGPSLSQSVICPTPSLHRVGEVLGAVGHLVAGDREQGDDRPDHQDDHQARREPARHAASVHRGDHRLDQRGDEHGHHDGQHDHHQEPEDAGDQVRRGGDDQEPPRPRGRQVDAPGHVRPREVRGAGHDRLGRRRRRVARPRAECCHCWAMRSVSRSPEPSSLGLARARRARPSRLVSAVAHADRLVPASAAESPEQPPAGRAVRRLGVPARRVARPRPARSRGRPRRAVARGSCQPPSTSPTLPPSTRSATPGRPWRSTPPDPTSRSTSRRSLPLRSTTRPSGPTTTWLRPACRRRARPTAAAAMRSSSRTRRRSSGRKPGSARRTLGRPAARSVESPAASTVEVADQRMPRSPSTVRVTGVVATTSRERSPPRGRARPPSARRWWRRPRRRPRRRRRPVLLEPRASSSTPVSTTSGVAPVTIAVKSARLLRCLPPITWDRNISRIAARAESGASTPMRGTTLSATTYGLSCQDRLDLGPGVDVARHDHGAGPAAGHERPGAASTITSVLPPSVPPVSSTTSGWVVCPRLRQSARRHTTRAATHLDHPAAAGQGDPAAGLGGDQLLVADARRSAAHRRRTSRPAPRRRRPAGPAGAGRRGTRRTRRARRSRWWSGATPGPRSGPRPGRPAPPW